MINFKKNYRKKIRSCIREYNRLGRENNIQILRNLKRVLANEQLEYRFDKIDSLILGSKTFDIGLIIRQFLVQNYLGQSFIKEVLNGMDKNNKYPCYTIPPIWQKKLKSQGFKISVVKSNIKWNIAIFLRLLNGIFIFAVTFLRSLQNVFLSSAHIGGSVFFLDLRLNNLPNNHSPSYDLISWYHHRIKDHRSIKTIFHSVRGTKEIHLEDRTVRYERPPYQVVFGFVPIFRFLVWGSIAVIVSLYFWMRGRWWIPLLLGEVIKSKVVDLMPMSRRSDRYLFHYSGSVYRPLWTYRFEQSSTEIICYFYSTYDQPSIGKESTDFSEVEFSLLNWPKFLVWDAFQKQKIENAIGDRYLVSIVGPVLFSDSFELSPDVVNDYVAVFNIDPHRISSFFGISTLADYYFNCPEVQIRFLLDLEKVCSELDIDIVIKYKRDIGERAVKSYLAHQGRLSGDKHVHFADPNISPLRIIEKSMAVVSAPFTSTALYGVRKRVPSVFYDPSGWIDPKDPSARDIKVISGIDSLRRWLIGVVALGRQ